MDADGFRPQHLPTSKPAVPAKDQAPVTPSLRLAEASDSVSLHTTHGIDRYYDDDPTELHGDDLPPLYSDVGEDGTSGTSTTPQPYALGPPPRADAPPMFMKETNSGNEYYIDRRMDTDPEYLQQQVEYLACFPPRPLVQLRGTHTETVKKDKKTERNTVVDFDVKVDLTPFLYSDINHQTSWSELRTVDNFEKVRRGTLTATRAPGFGGKSSGAVQLETGGEEKPTLKEWCHRYCASHAGLKSLLVRRRVVGFDEDAVKAKLENLARATQYRGHITVSFPVKGARVEIYNEALTNRWRLTWWVQWLFMFTLLFLLAIPYLFLRTQRFEVIVVDWYFSRVNTTTARKEWVSLSEEQWYNMWGRAIQKAVLARRQGFLDQTDLREAEGAEPSFESALEGIGSGNVSGLVRAGINAMNVVNRQFGWGGDC